MGRKSAEEVLLKAGKLDNILRFLEFKYISHRPLHRSHRQSVPKLPRKQDSTQRLGEIYKFSEQKQSKPLIRPRGGPAKGDQHDRPLVVTEIVS
ncbi:hypothetical protein TSMEX_000054 [Taenia solium]|eukprot:TsM_001130900 transcript=TsM_001130900 gene=TsM_001130900